MTRKVLLVDDVPEYLDTMELYLPDGCTVVMALSATEAQAKVEAEAGQLDLVVVDVRLHDDDAENRDGLVLLQWIHETYTDLPVIVISAFGGFEYEAEAMALGAECFLKKPIRPDEFHQAIARLLPRT